MKEDVSDSTNRIVRFKAFAQNCNCEFTIRASARPEGVKTAEARLVGEGSYRLVRPFPIGPWFNGGPIEVTVGEGVSYRLEEKIQDRASMHITSGIYER